MLAFCVHLYFIVLKSVRLKWLKSHQLTAPKFIDNRAGGKICCGLSSLQSIVQKVFFENACSSLQKRYLQIFSFINQNCMAQTQISEVCQSANPKTCNDLSANRKSANFLGVPIRKSQIRKFSRKKAMFLMQIRTDLPTIFFYLCKYHTFLTTKIPCNSFSELSQKPNIVMKFEWKHFKLKEKNIFAEVFS